MIPGGSQREGQNPTILNKIDIARRKKGEKDGIYEKHNLLMVFMLKFRGVGKRKQAFRSILVAKYEVWARREKTSKMDCKMAGRNRKNLPFRRPGAELLRFVWFSAEQDF